MKKYLILLVVAIVGATSTAFGQTATINNDLSATYKGVNYQSGQELTIGYGSGENKNFAFISVFRAEKGSNSMPSTTNLKAEDSKKKFIIDDIYKTDAGKVFIKAVPEWLKEDGYAVDLRVDLEGAIDNKELIEPKAKPVSTVTKKTVKKHS